MKNTFRHRGRARRGGSTIILVTFAMTVLLGFCAFAVDYGMMVADANRLQRACDAAALAGATKLMVSGYDTTAIATDEANARYLAALTAYRNGVTVNQNDITFPTAQQILVPARTTRNFFFGRALGMPNGVIARSAKAGRVALAGVTGAVPLAITTTDYFRYLNGRKFNEDLIINHDTDFAPGTITALDLRPDNSGKSGAVFENDLTDGFNGTIYINQQIDNALNSDLSSQGNKMEDAIQQRITDAANAPYHDTGNNYTWPNYPPDDRRVMLIIVANPNPADNSNPMLNAQWFVPVYIEGSQNQQKGETVSLRILPTYTESSLDPNVILGNSTTPFTGPSVVTLQG